MLQLSLHMSRLNVYPGSCREEDGGIRFDGQVVKIHLSTLCFCFEFLLCGEHSPRQSDRVRVNEYSLTFNWFLAYLWKFQFVHTFTFDNKVCNRSPIILYCLILPNKTWFYQKLPDNSIQNGQYFNVVINTKTASGLFQLWDIRVHEKNNIYIYLFKVIIKNIELHIVYLLDINK